MSYLMKILFLFGLALASTFAQAPTSTDSYLTSIDKTRLKQVIEPGFKLQDLSEIHYAVFGYNLLGENIKNKPEICSYLLNSSGDGSSITPENSYYIISTWKELRSCQQLPFATFTKALTAAAERPSSTIPELYHAVASLLALNQKISDATKTKVVKTLQAALKKDESLLNLGYLFNIAADLGPAGAFAYDRIDDVIIQADEVDGRILQFEGGLSVTSMLINGIYKISSALNKKVPLNTPQMVKLANYILSRRSVRTPKGVVNVLSSLNMLSANPQNQPICIAIAKHEVSNQQALVQVKVCNVLGQPLSTIPTVVANSATKIGDDVVVISKKNFQPSQTDKTIFTLNFMETNPEPGFYKIAISVGSVSNTVVVKVLTEVAVDFIEIGTIDSDQTTQAQLLKVPYPDKLTDKIEADSQQKLVVRFLLKDAVKRKPIRVHQAFVRLVSKSDKDKHEITFVAEPDSSHIYKFDMVLETAAKNFGFKSGDYSVELIIGDAVLSNSFQSTLAIVNLKIADLPAKYKQKQNVYSPKIEIEHMFREPEKRPPAFVSDLFTGLCLAPFLLLFIIWAKLGVNISNFPFSLSAVVFHSGLGGIFVLFGIFWLKLDMFVTLRYLFGLGVVTFLAGNKLLSQIARTHKSSR